MEQFIVTILTVLLALPAYYSDNELEAERKTRLTTVATASSYVCYAGTCSGKFNTEECVPIFKGTINQCGAALVTIGFWESRFAKHIHEGKCREGGFRDGKYYKGECDESVLFNLNKTIVISRVFRSRTVWQMQYDPLIRSEWFYMNGSSQIETTYAAQAALKKWSRCWPNVPHKAFMCYAGTRNPNWNGAKPRASFYEARLRQLEPINEKTNEKIALADL